MTIHKVQSLTLPKLVISLQRSFEFGQPYVALSRVRRLQDLAFLEPPTLQTLTPKRQTRAPKAMNHISKLVAMADDTKQRYPDLMYLVQRRDTGRVDHDDYTTGTDANLNLMHQLFDERAPPRRPFAAQEAEAAETEAAAEHEVQAAGEAQLRAEGATEAAFQAEAEAEAKAMAAAEAAAEAEVDAAEEYMDCEDRAF